MKQYLAILALSGVLTASAYAQNDVINGVASYVTGNPAGQVGGFSPGVGFGPDGTAEELRVLDQGANGDVAADDGLYSVLVDNLTSGTVLEWKVASDTFSPVNSPSFGPNQYAQVPASGEITFFIQTTAFGDGFEPEVGAGSADSGGYAYASTHATFFSDATEVAAVGNFQTSNGGSADFNGTDPGRIILADQGGNQFSGSATGLPGGNYEFKIVTDGDFSPADVSTEGLSAGGGNIPFTSAGPTDTITIDLDGNTARYRVTNAAVLPDGIYAQSAEWGTTFDASTEMTETFASSGIFTRTYTITAAGSYTARVREVVSNAQTAFPDTGDIPFTTTVPNQDIIVVFDTNTYADGFNPTNNMAIVLDDATRTSLSGITEVQAAGSFQIDFGGSNFGEDASFRLTDQGDDLWTWTSPIGALANGNSPAEYKTAARTIPGDGYFSYQVGGGGSDTVTISGNNPNVSPGIAYNAGEFISMVADVAWGRIAMFADVSDPGVSTLEGRAPARPGYLGGTSVDSWSAFE